MDASEPVSWHPSAHPHTHREHTAMPYSPPADYVGTYAVPMMPGTMFDAMETVMSHPGSSLVNLISTIQQEVDYVLVSVRGTTELHTALQQDYVAIGATS